MTVSWWIVCGPITGIVDVDTVTGKIDWAVPALSKFKGQPLGNIRKWAKQKGWDYIEHLYEEEK